MSDIPKSIENYYNKYIGGKNIDTWWNDTADYIVRSHFTKKDIDSDDSDSDDSDSDDSDSGSDYEWSEIDKNLDKETIEKVKAFHKKYIMSKRVHTFNLWKVMVHSCSISRMILDWAQENGRAGAAAEGHYVRTPALPTTSLRPSLLMPLAEHFLSAGHSSNKLLVFP